MGSSSRAGRAVELLRSIVSSNVMMVVFGVVAAITAGAAFMWSKHPVRWILALLTIGLVYLLITFDPDGLGLDPQLPANSTGGCAPGCSSSA